MGIGIKDGIRLEFILSRPGILSVLQKTQEIGCADPRRCAPVDTGKVKLLCEKEKIFRGFNKTAFTENVFLGMGSNFVGVLHIHNRIDFHYLISL